MKYISCSVTLILLILFGGFICVTILGITGHNLLYAGSAVGMISQRLVLGIFGPKYVFFTE